MMREPDERADEIRTYASGEVSSRRGRVNRWLIVVYVLLTAWAVYYLIHDWGGLGPGLDLAP